MKVYVNVDYGHKPNELQLAALRKHDPSVEVYPQDFEHDWMRGTVKGPFCAELDELLVDKELEGLKFSVGGGSVDAGIFNWVLQKMREIVGAPRQHVDGAPTYTINVPSLGLLLIDEVVSVDDCSESLLRSHLDDGWRIICVLPSADDIGPGFMLGRKKQET